MKMINQKTESLGMSTIQILLIEQAKKLHPNKVILDSGGSYRKKQLK